VKKILFAATLIAAFSVFAMGANVQKTAKEAGQAGLRGSQITLTPPHACSVSGQHPCVYYGGDINASDPEENGLSNENTGFISNSYTYEEVKVPVSASVTAAFSNNLSTYGVIDPKTALSDWRSGVSEGNGGTDLCSGDNEAEITATGRNAFGYNEYEVLTLSPCKLTPGNTWISVVPNCTNLNDGDCTNSPRFFVSDTNGPNAINGSFTITSNTGLGPTFNSSFFGIVFGSWCNDEGVACGDGISLGVLR
jgi:hypothetical protein